MNGSLQDDPKLDKPVRELSPQDIKQREEKKGRIHQ